MGAKGPCYDYTSVTKFLKSQPSDFQLNNPIFGFKKVLNHVTCHVGVDKPYCVRYTAMCNKVAPR